MHNAYEKLDTIKYKILPDYNIIIEQYNGSITMEDLITAKKEISKQSNYSPNFNVIMDFEHADLVFGSAKLKDYVQFANTFKRIYGKRKTAFLTNTPNEVVLTTLFGMQKGDLPIDSSTFSTIEAIADWLGFSQEIYEIIKNTLKQFKQ